MDLKEVKELIELVSEKGFAEFEIEHDGFRLHISRFVEAAPVAPPAPVILAAQMPAMPEPVAPAATPALQPATPAAPPAKAESAQSEANLHIVTSPIVGTFYRSASPEAPPFVEIGTQVEKGTVLCIIEAMKLMNEIESDVDGGVRKIYVSNGQPVEYGQPLFGIEF